MTFFLSRSATWKNCKIRFFITTLLKTGIDREAETKRVKDKVVAFLDRYRINNKSISVEVELIDTD